MTLALSNFMRQAAREDILAYSICSAVLEGTTVEPRTLQPVLREVRRALRHPARRRSRRSTRTSTSTCSTSTRDLFLEILDDGRRRSRPSARRRVLDYGHQLVEHIWMWTDNIEKYYEDEANPMPRAPVRPVPRLRRTASMQTTMTDAPSCGGAPRSSRDDGRVAIEHLDEEIALEGAGAALLRARCCRTSTARAPSTRSPSELDGAARARARARRAAREGGRASRSVDDGRRRADDRRSSSTSSTAATSRHWLRAVYDHPLWEKIATGKATRAQVIGFAFEKYHYIEGAYEHMAIAAANATPEMMPHLARHFIEEYNHGDIYRKGLRSLFPDERRAARAAAPEHARAGQLPQRVGGAQLVRATTPGNELLQMTENTERRRGDAGRSTTSTTRCASTTRTPTSSIDSFIAHTNADQKLGHENVFLQMCESVPPLSRREVDDALNVARSMAEHLLLFMDGIDVHLRPLPRGPARRRCDLLSE